MEIKTSGLKELLKHSFLGKVKLDDYTDIVFNGKNLYGESLNSQKEILIVNLSNQEVGDFLNHLANLLGKNFNTLHPILDVAFLTYRLSAVHPSIARCQEKGLYNFSLRIFKPRIAIDENDQEILPIPIKLLLKQLIINNCSLLLSGLTGSGKTEMQKYLIGLMKENTRIIIIEDIYESFIKELFPHLDIQSWVTFNNQEKLKEEMNRLIKCALRNNPQWLIISEVRGKEASEMLTSLTTGHPLITTIHALSAYKSMERFINLLENKDDETFRDLIDYLFIAIHMEKRSEGNKTIRYIKEIVEYDYKELEIIKKPIYERKQNEKFFYPLSIRLQKKLQLKEFWYEEN